MTGVVVVPGDGDDRDADEAGPDELDRAAEPWRRAGGAPPKTYVSSSEMDEVNSSRAHACWIRSVSSLGETGLSPNRRTRKIPTVRRKEDEMIEEGAPAPDFTLMSDSGEAVTLSSLRGKDVVLYFYPKDDTPGCTAQACGIRDAWGAFEDAGAVVLGVSPDSKGSHQKFKAKYDLPFTLLADTEHAVADAYGVWGEKSYAGKTYMGVHRSTFVIDADGNVARAFHDVKPAEHTDQVLEALRA